MHTDTACLPPTPTYAALLAELRIAALRALADILATSDDPTEKRHAATVILRAPEPEPPRAPRPHSESDEPARPAREPRRAFAASTNPLPPATMRALTEALASAKRALTGVPDLESLELNTASPSSLPDAPRSPAARLISIAGQAPPS